MIVFKDTLAPWLGERVNDIALPGNIEDVWSDADLAEYGLARVVTVDVPDGKVVVGDVPLVVGKDGLVTENPTLADAPPPPPPLTFVEFLASNGFAVADVKKALGLA